jgi:hypothetical protein
VARPLAPAILRSGVVSRETFDGQAADRKRHRRLRHERTSFLQRYGNPATLCSNSFLPLRLPDT